MNLQKLNKRWLLFAIAVFAQFASIFYWVISSEETIANGTVLKFRLMGYDPHDPFRGEYLRIQFRDNTLSIPKEEFDEEEDSKQDYVVFDIDYDGFAIPAYFSSYPEELSLKVNKTHSFTLSFTSETKDDSITYRIIYPFDRIWMNQEECPIAERLINKALRKNRDVYATISVNNGEGVLTGVEIEGTNIKELVKSIKKGEVEEEWEAEDLERTAIAISDSINKAAEDTISKHVEEVVNEMEMTEDEENSSLE